MTWWGPFSSIAFSTCCCLFYNLNEISFSLSFSLEQIGFLFHSMQSCLLSKRLMVRHRYQILHICDCNRPPPLSLSLFLEVQIFELFLSSTFFSASFSSMDIWKKRFLLPRRERETKKNAHGNSWFSFFRTRNEEICIMLILPYRMEMWGNSTPLPSRGPTGTDTQSHLFGPHLSSRLQSWNCLEHRHRKCVGAGLLRLACIHGPRSSSCLQPAG